MKKVLLVLVVLIFGINGFVFADEYSSQYSGDVSVNHFENNHCPTVSAGSDKVVNSGESVDIIGSAVDQDGDQVSVSWSASRGSFGNARSLSTRYIAPRVTKNTMVTLTFTGTDNKGGIGSDKMAINIVANEPSPVPTVNPYPTPVPTYVPIPVPTLPPYPVPTTTINHNPTVYIAGQRYAYSENIIYVNAIANDIDGDQLSYRWTASEGYVNTPSGVSTTIKMPLVKATIQVSVMIYVTDGKGGQAFATLPVTVMPKPTPVPTYKPTPIPTSSPTPIPTTGPTNNPPTATISGTTVVNSGDLITASVSAYDPDGDQLYYFWSASEGAVTVDPSGLSVTVTSPNHISSIQYMTVSVRVSDNRGGEVIETMNVQVNPIGTPTPIPTTGPTNNPPTATISGTTVVNSGDLITASVSAYDPDGDQLYYFWSASEGAVTVDPSGLSVTVTSPNHISSIQYMTVSVRVSDNRGGEVIETMNVQVNPIGNGPSSYSSAQISIPENQYQETVYSAPSAYSEVDNYVSNTYSSPTYSDVEVYSSPESNTEYYSNPEVSKSIDTTISTTPQSSSSISTPTINRIGNVGDVSIKGII
ncbi:hypothetical protein M0R01_02500 [bacterium]|nr:hypothetical protein [bacterium]